MNHRKKVKSAGVALLIVSILGILCGALIYGFGQFASYGAKEIAEKVTDKKYQELKEKLNNPQTFEDLKIKELFAKFPKFTEKQTKDILKPEFFLGYIDGLKILHKHRGWYQLYLNYHFLATLITGAFLCLIARSWIKVKPFDKRSIRYWKLLGMFLLLGNISSLFIDVVYNPYQATSTFDVDRVSSFVSDLFLVPALSQLFVLGSITLGIICLTIGLILENGRQAMEEQEHTV